MSKKLKEGKKMIIGVDLGNFAVKTSKGVYFLSKLSQDKSLNEHSDILEFDDKHYSLEEGFFDTEYRKAYKKSLLPLLYAAIGLSTDDTKNEIVCGLPLSQYREDKEYLRNLILQNSNKTITINGARKKIFIDDIEVVPEGVAAVPNDFEGVVIDIGGRTTDVCLLTHEGFKRKIKKPYSLAQGMLNLEGDFIKVINNKFGLDLSLDDASRILKSGLKIYGEEQNIEFAMFIYHTFVNSIISLLQVDYSLKTYDIALVGGGAKTLYKTFKNAMPNTRLIENSFFANAIGYERIGENIWL